MAEDGDVLRFDASGGRMADRVAGGPVLIDGTRTGEIADEVLRDRRHLAGDGLVVVRSWPSTAGRARSSSRRRSSRAGLAVDPRHDERAAGGARPAGAGHRGGAARGTDRPGAAEGAGPPGAAAACSASARAGGPWCCRS